LTQPENKSLTVDVIGYAKFYSRSRHAGIRVYDEADRDAQMGEFKEW
jgi:hypothetical protein